MDKDILLLKSQIKPNTVNFFVKCKTCGWPSVEVCCNDNFTDGLSDEDEHEDWWVYCLNKGCVNHHGYPVGQDCDDIREKFEVI